MEKYESPKAEYLQLDDVITASEIEICTQCVQTPTQPTPDDEGTCPSTLDMEAGLMNVNSK